MNSGHSVTSPIASASVTASRTLETTSRPGTSSADPIPRPLHRVIGDDRGSSCEEVPRDVERRRVAEVVGEGLEGQPKQPDALALEGPADHLAHARHEVRSLPMVDLVHRGEQRGGDTRERG